MSKNARIAQYNEMIDNCLSAINAIEDGRRTYMHSNCGKVTRTQIAGDQEFYLAQICEYEEAMYAIIR